MHAFPQIPSNSDELTIVFQQIGFLRGFFASPAPWPNELFTVPMILDHPLWVSRNWPLLSGVIALSQIIFNNDLIIHSILLGAYACLIYFFFRNKKNKFILLTLVLLLISFNTFYQASFVNFYRSGILAAFASALSIFSFTIKDWRSALLYYIGILILSESRGGEGAIFFATTFIPHLLHQRFFFDLKQIVIYFSLFFFLCVSSICFYTYQTTGKLYPHPNTLWSQQYQENNPISFLPNRVDILETRPEVSKYFLQDERAARQANVQSFSSWVSYNIQKAYKYTLFHFGFFSFIFFLFGLFYLHSIPGITVKSFIFIFAINFIFLFSIIYNLRDYTAVLMPLIHITTINGVIELQARIRKPLFLIVSLTLILSIVSLGWMKNFNNALMFSASRTGRSNFYKSDFESKLPSGKNFIFVEVALNHDPNDVWTYNIPPFGAESNLYAWTLLPGSHYNLDEISQTQGRRIWCIYVDNSAPIMLHEVDFAPKSCRESWHKKQSRRELEQ